MDQRFESSRLRNDSSPLILTLKILFGLLIGSFINVLIVRVPKSESIITPGSHCILCNTPLKWWMNIPLFSFFIFGGKCCYCSGRISWQYPIVELLCAGIWILFFNFNYPFETTSLCLGICFLLAIAIIDLKHFQIYHGLLIASFIFLATSLFFGSFSWKYHIAGMVFCPGFIWGVSWIVQVFNKRKNLGGGDILLAISLGFYLGPYRSFLMYFIASVFGILYWVAMMKIKNLDKNPIQIPFGTGMVFGFILLEIVLLPSIISSFKFLEFIIFTDRFLAELFSLL